MITSARSVPLLPKHYNSFPIILFLIPIAIISLGDAIISYIFPLVLESHVNSNLLTGLIMGISSFVGLICDLVIPQIFPHKSWKFMLIAGTVIALTFPFAIYLGDTFGLVWIFIFAVILWGLYYEFLMFAQQSYVVAEEKKENYSRAWSLIIMVKDIVYIIGPIVGSILLLRGAATYTSIITILFIIALFFILMLFFFKDYNRSTPQKSKIKECIDFVKEIRYWGVLSRRIIPILVMALSFELISVTYWIFGGLFGQELMGAKGMDWIILVVSIVPSFVGSIILAKVKVKKRKKRYSQISLLLGGLVLIPIMLFQGNALGVLSIIFFSSLFTSFAWPLSDAVYSDLQERLKEKNIHLIGLSNASYSIAYMIVPIFMGYVADKVGYYYTFSILGILTTVIAILLLIFTPRKLKMPHAKLDNIK